MTVPDNAVNAVKVTLTDESGQPISLFVQTVGSGGEQMIAGGTPPLEPALDAINAVGNKVANAVKAIAPDKFSIELGFEFKAEAGGLVAMLVRSGGSASVKLTMEWERPKPTPPGGSG